MLYPMSAMVLLTFIIGVIALKARFNSVKSGELKAKYYALMQGENEPIFVTKTTRCFNNQFEIPVLFYVVGTLMLSLSIESFISIIFAWLFVLLRCVHAYIHLTYNHVMHRMLVFWLALLCVMGLWVNLLIQQI